MKKILKTILSLVCLLVATQICAADYQSSTIPQEITLCDYPSTTRYKPKLLVTPRQGFYIEGFASTNFSNFFKGKHSILRNIKTNHSFGTSLGYSWGNGLRNEIELAYYRSKDINFRHKAQERGGISCMANALYDFNISSLRPYIGLGAGCMVHGPLVGLSFAGQACAGINYEICDKTEIGVKYNYLFVHKSTPEQSVRLVVRRFF